MANEPKTRPQTQEIPETKKELTFDQQLVKEGWPVYYVTARLEWLPNPDKNQGTFGLIDAIGKKQVVIVIPTDEVLRAFTEFAKKVAAKT